MGTLAVLVLFSFSRRSGPVRELPPPVRATPVEFVEALGSLYRNAGAATTAVAIAWEQFRRQAMRLCGMRGERMDAVAIAAALQRRFPRLDPGLEADLQACEQVAGADTVHPKRALQLVQMLAAHMEKLKASARPRALNAVVAGDVHSNSQERAS
jgi:hypothetical protein